MVPRTAGLMDGLTDGLTAGLITEGLMADLTTKLLVGLMPNPMLNPMSNLMFTVDQPLLILNSQRYSQSCRQPLQMLSRNLNVDRDLVETIRHTLWQLFQDNQLAILGILGTLATLASAAPKTRFLCHTSWTQMPTIQMLIIQMRTLQMFTTLTSLPSNLTNDPPLQEELSRSVHRLLLQ